MNTRNIGNEAKINPKTGRIDQACERYGVGRSTMRRIAEESGAVVRVGRTYLINYSSLRISFSRDCLMILKMITN